MGSGLDFFTNWTDKTPGTVGSWVDVDCSADIPVGATGVILRIANTGAAIYNCNVRKNGSTDNVTTNIGIRNLHHIFALIGVDSNRIFECYVDNAAIKVYLVGYTDGAVTFFDNEVDKSLGTTAQWLDMDCSGQVPSGATGVILRIQNTGTASARKGNVRKNGSTDDDKTNCGIHLTCHIWALIGVDSGRIFEGYISSLEVDFYLIGYTTSPITFFDNEKDESLGVTGAWTDIDATADTEAAADGIIIRIINTTSTAKKGDIRKNGSTNNDTARSKVTATGHIWALCGLNGDNIYEGYIDDLAVDFKVIGYAKPSGILKETTDSISLGDSVLRDRTLAVTDTLSLSDVSPLTDRILAISDAIIFFAEQVSTPSRIVVISDSAGLTEAMLVGKLLIVSDAVQLADLAEKLLPSLGILSPILVIGQVLEITYEGLTSAMSGDGQILRITGEGEMAS